MPYVLMINKSEKPGACAKTHSPVVVSEIDQHTLPTRPIEGLARDFTSPQELLEQELLEQELLELELLLPTLLPSRPLLELQRYKASTSQSTSHTGD